MLGLLQLVNIAPEPIIGHVFIISDAGLENIDKGEAPVFNGGDN